MTAAQSYTDHFFLLRLNGQPDQQFLTPQGAFTAKLQIPDATGDLWYYEQATQPGRRLVHWDNGDPTDLTAGAT